MCTGTRLKGSTGGSNLDRDKAPRPAAEYKQLRTLLLALEDRIANAVGKGETESVKPGEALFDLLASLKKAWGGGRVAFWRALLADAELKAGKITAEETEDSEVTAAQAAEFWRDVDGGAAAAAVPAATQPGATQDEDEYDDLE